MHPFTAIYKATAVLDGLDCPWFIAGGWAIDLFLGRVTRPHKDVDFAVLRCDQLAFQQHLAGWRLRVAHAGNLVPWQSGEYLAHPLHVIWAERDDHDPSMIELLLNDVMAGQFRFRRDPAIRMPAQRMGFVTEVGVPVLAPEIVLLYKAKRPAEPAAAVDFAAAWPALDPQRRQWLRAGIEKLYPDHPWLDTIRSDS